MLSCVLSRESFFVNLLRGVVPCTGSFLRKMDQVKSRKLGLLLRRLLPDDICVTDLALEKRDESEDEHDDDELMEHEIPGPSLLPLLRFNDDSLWTAWTACTLRLLGTRDDEPLLPLGSFFSWRMSRLLRARSKNLTTCSIRDRYICLFASVWKRSVQKEELITVMTRTRSRTTLSLIVIVSVKTEERKKYISIPVSIAIEAYRFGFEGIHCRSLGRVALGCSSTERLTIFDSLPSICRIAVTK